MNIKEFDYILPKENIAQEPLLERDQAKLLIVDRSTDSFREAIFKEVVELLPENSILALNDTRVIPARLKFRKPSGGRIELLILKEISDCQAETLLRGRFRPGQSFALSDNISVLLDKKLAESKYLVSFSGATVKSVLKNFGEIPLPPYINRMVRPQDNDYYQTVYGCREGAVAAPTAGLHFTPELLKTLTDKGIDPVCITLHVGWGTFQTIRTEDITEHRMEPEYFEISEASAVLINAAKRRGRKIVAVGTTVMRTLEGNFASGCLSGGSGWVNVFIYPGHQFRSADVFLTNFHLPGTTTLLLTAAFAGREKLLNAYEYALRHNFRFGSYGDAMLIL